MKLGTCKVCKGDIVEVGWSLGAQFFCKDCGIVYHEIPKQMCTKDGLRMLYNIE